MKQSILHIHMLGSFSLSWDDKKINDSDNRMRKVWLLLAYLIYRRTVVSLDGISDLLWSEDEKPGNPASALKTMMHRVRTLLNQLDDNAGAALILRRDNGYLWNPEIPVSFDVAEADALCQKVSMEKDPSARLALQLEFLELYEGDFLPRLSSESWVVPISAYYHRIWLETIEDVLPQLEEAGQWSKSASLCASALKIEPYSESIYCHLIRAQIVLGDRTAAVSSYETMCDLLFSQFGVMPSEEAMALYRQASRSDGFQSAHISSVKEMLQETAATRGALFCQYDFFRILYQAQARAIVRSGDTVHIALLTVNARKNEELSRRSLDIAAENLKHILIDNLRQGDIVTQFSVNQFLFMLPQANYENSCMVCDRLIRAFYRQYPHSPADIHFGVMPLEPLVSADRTPRA